MQELGAIEISQPPFETDTVKNYTLTHDVILAMEHDCCQPSSFLHSFPQ